METTLSGDLPPGIQLFNNVKAAFVARGVPFSRWCRDNEFDPANVRSALTGNWNGPKAELIRSQVKKAAFSTTRQRSAA